MSAIMKKNYTQKFRKEWLEMGQFDKWLREVPGDNTKAYCLFCRCEIAAKFSLLTKHALSKKHVTYVPFKSHPSTANVEGKLALHLCCHALINTCDHLVGLFKNSLKDSEVVLGLRMDRNKCITVIEYILAPHFKDKVVDDIGDGKFSLLLDESDGISVHKILGIVIIYFSKSLKKVVHTFLSLVELSSCDAESIVDALKCELASCRLNINNLIAIGTDNTSAMVEVNKGVFKKLKEEVPLLILVRCVCHSLQLAVSRASIDVLPGNLEFLIGETYEWFAYSSRQATYCQLYKAINDSQTPLKKVNKCSIQWLSIESCVGRILKHWLELKTHFEIVRNKERCYTAELLYEMYKDEKNLLYLLFLHPVLVQVQRVNKIFESDDMDKTKIFEDLSHLIKSIALLLVLPNKIVDPLHCNIEEYLNPEPDLGKMFERKVTELKTSNRLNHEEEIIIRNKCKMFLLSLFQQLKQRLPENLDILKQASCFSIENILNPLKEEIKPILQFLCDSEEEIAAVEFQYNNIHLIKWTNVENTEQFWLEVSQFQDAAGMNPFKQLSDFAINLLLLPNSSAEIERIFCSMNIVKNKLKNRMDLPLLRSILHVKYGLKLSDKSCGDYELPSSVTNMIASMSAIKQEDEEYTSHNITCDVLFED